MRKPYDAPRVLGGVPWNIYAFAQFMNTGFLTARAIFHGVRWCALNRVVDEHEHIQAWSDSQATEEA
jgi:hypothetical protein